MCYTGIPVPEPPPYPHGQAAKGVEQQGSDEVRLVFWLTTLEIAARDRKWI
jgi:hypothetical protein